MIKSLLGEDENKEKKAETSDIKGDKQNPTQNSIIPLDDAEPQKIVKTENDVVDGIEDEIETIDDIKTAIETGEIPAKQNPATIQPFEVNRPIGQPVVEKDPSAKQTSSDPENTKVAQENEGSEKTLELERKLREIEDELRKEKELEAQRSEKESLKKAQGEQITRVEPIIDESEVETVVRATKTDQQGDWSDWNKSDDTATNEIQIKPKDFVPETKAEGFRKMGMAWSAVIAFGGSMVFMIVLGWGADTLLGSQPWGIVTGVVLGAAIGFFQLIRTTSQIFKPKPNEFDKVSLKSNISSVVESGKEDKIDEKSETVSTEETVANKIEINDQNKENLGSIMTENAENKSVNE